jgi:hypothetical protein
VDEDTQGLHDALTADFASDGGDPADATPVAAPETPEATSEGRDSENQAPEATPSDAPEALLSDEERKANPWLAEREKQMQAAMTRATQRAAEAAKQYEGIDPAEAEWIRRFKQAQMYNPAQARQMAEELAQQLSQSAAPTAETEYPEWVFSDEGRMLYDQQRRQSSFIEEMRRQQQEAEAERQFSSLEKEFGAITPQQRYEVVQRMASLSHPERPIPLSEIPNFYRGMFGYQAALQRGRNEASQVVQVKNGIGPPPGGVTPRPQEVDLDPGKMSLSDWLEKTTGA